MRPVYDGFNMKFIKNLLSKLGIKSAGSQVTRYTAPINGVYRVSSFGSSGSIKKNGAMIVRNSSLGERHQMITADVNLSQGDILEIDGLKVSAIKLY